jgi:hypothetical protein
MRRRPVLLAAVAVAAAACSGSSGYSEREVAPATTAVSSTATTEPATGPVDDAPADTEPSAPASPAPDVVVPDGPAIVDGVANSLVVVHDLAGGAASLASYRADGTLVTTYSAEPDATIWQPIWAPDGRRLAWTRSTDGTVWELVTAAVDGSERTTHELPGRPDYITYDPTASRVLALTPSPQGFGLVIVETGGGVDATQPFTVVDLGRPYYSDFSPDGERLIAHVAADMRVVDLSGERRSLELLSVGHQAPVWHPSDDVVYFTTDSGLGERVVSHRLDTGATAELTGSSAFVFLDLDPTGERLAISAFGAAPEGSGDVIDAFRSPPRQGSPDALGTGVWIVDSADGATTLLDERPATAPMWDPTGTQVLVRDSLSGVGRWHVFALDGTRTGTVGHDVDESLLPTYLPFWDQYERSQTVWAPDGRYFVHVGASEDGRSGVWVHDASTSGASSFLVDGDVAFWSPT